jgi:hypothetical protein
MLKRNVPQVSAPNHKRVLSAEQLRRIAKIKSELKKLHEQLAQIFGQPVNYQE